jgi:Fe-S oxidoreductase
VLKDLWSNEDIKEALELCFSCKSCKSECPVQVDMATYKSEFFSHYYETHPRPRHAYSMGLIHRWARLASIAPGVVNFIGQSPRWSALVKDYAGIAQQRSLPKFAEKTFTRWFKSRRDRLEGEDRVLLWPDTFNNYFHPESAIAATRVLEACGYTVSIPPLPLCCGRALYDFGMLDQAKVLLARSCGVSRRTSPKERRSWLWSPPACRFSG